MLNYNFTWVIAENVFDSLGLPEDMYLQLDENSIKEFSKQYSEEYIRSLVDAELTKYDTSDNDPSDIEDLRETAIEDVMYKIEAIKDDYYRSQIAIMEDAYAEIVNALENTAFQNIISIDTEFEPADPDVGIFDDERYINFKLSNGKYITLKVEFED